jgi:Cdc6-like AAA superfamily ATPase
MMDRKITSKFSKLIIVTQKDRQEELKNAYQARERKRRVEKIYQRDILKLCTGCVARVGKILSAAKKKVTKAMRE